MAGVAWLTGPDLLWGASVNVWAEFAVLLAALSYALSAIFARRMPAFGLKPIDVAAGQATAATVFSLRSPSSSTSLGCFRPRASR